MNKGNYSRCDRVKEKNHLILCIRTYHCKYPDKERSWWRRKRKNITIDLATESLACKCENWECRWWLKWEEFESTNDVILPKLSKSHYCTSATYLYIFISLSNYLQGYFSYNVQLLSHFGCGYLRELAGESEWRNNKSKH